MSEPGVVEDGVEGDGDGREDDDDPLTEIVVFLVLGAGFLALFAGIESFWMVWVLGFAVLLPLVAVLSKHYGPFLGSRSGERERTRDHQSARSEAESALETLKERYARGEIDEAEFEHRLERLVENEDVEDVERRLAEDDDPEFDYELER